MDLPGGAHPKARWVVCPVTGKPFLYPGYGRPARVHPDARRARRAQRSRERYQAKRAGAPPRKRGRPTKAEVAARVSAQA